MGTDGEHIGEYSHKAGGKENSCRAANNSKILFNLEIWNFLKILKNPKISKSSNRYVAVVTRSRTHSLGCGILLYSKSTQGGSTDTAALSYGFSVAHGTHSCQPDAENGQK